MLWFVSSCDFVNVLAEISPEIRVSVYELSELETVVRDRGAEVEARDLVGLWRQASESILADQEHELIRRADPRRVRTRRKTCRHLNGDVRLNKHRVQIRWAADHLRVQRGASQRPGIYTPANAVIWTLELVSGDRVLAQRISPRGERPDVLSDIQLVSEQLDRILRGDTEHPAFGVFAVIGIDLQRFTHVGRGIFQTPE